MLLQLCQCGQSRFVLACPQFGLGDQTAEVLISDAGFNQHRVVRRSRRQGLTDRQFRAYMRFDPARLGGQVKPRRTVKTIAIEHRHRWELLLGTSVGQSFWNRCSLEETERTARMEFHELHQSYRPSTNQASCRRSRNIRYRPTPFESWIAMSHSSRRHSSLFHQLPDVLHGPAEQTIAEDTSAKEIWMGLPVWQRTSAGNGGRNILMVTDGPPVSSPGVTRFLCTGVKAVIRKSSDWCDFSTSAAPTFPRPWSSTSPTT